MLTIDIGNSVIKWGIWQDGQLILAEAGSYSKDTLPETLDELFSDAPKQDEVWVACVVGSEVESILTDWMQKQWSIAPSFLRTTAEFGGVQNIYQDPSQHGADRWAALLGAKWLYDTPVCVIDVGTAVTVDLMDASGIHRGGRIMPGLDMMRNALLQHTEGIREVEGDSPGFAINTADAVTSGTLHMLCAGLVEVCESAKQRLGEGMQVIITGGMAEKVMPLLDIADMRHEPHLVLQGLFHASQQ